MKRLSRKIHINVTRRSEYVKKTTKEKLNNPLCITKEDEREFDKTNVCWICENKIYDERKKVMDHDHCREGRNYRGVAHRTCNALLRVTSNITCIAHNSERYDLKLLVNDLAKTKMKIDIVPDNFENYKSLRLGNDITFIDSYNHLNYPLSKLMDDLIIRKKEGNKMGIDEKKN